jgi:hypothetical protein
VPGAWRVGQPPGVVAVVVAGSPVGHVPSMVDQA